MKPEDLQQAIKYAESIIKIVDNHNLSWEAKYEHAFSLYKDICDLGCNIDDYYYLDGDYDEDVMDLYWALQPKLKEWKQILKAYEDWL